MTYDNNKDRNERIRHLPDPVSQHASRVENGDFEDQALDTTLRILADSRHDGEAFLERLNSRLEKAKLTSSDEDCNEQTFFGFAPSLLEKVESPPRSAEVSSTEKPDMAKRYRIVLALISAAALLLIGFVGWGSLLPKSVNDSVSLVIPGEAPESIQNNQPNMHTSSKVKIANRESTPTGITEAPITVVETWPTEKRAEATEIAEPQTAVASADAPLKETTNVTRELEVEPFWHFKLEFDESNNATAWIGKRKIQDNIPLRGSNAAFKSICHEVAKQVHYYSPVLAVQWQGKILISGTEFRFEESFDGIDEMVEAGTRIRGLLREQMGRPGDGKTQFGPIVIPAFDAFPAYNKLNLLHDRVLQQTLAVTDKLIKANLDTAADSRQSESVLYKNFTQIEARDLLLVEDEIIPAFERDLKTPFPNFAAFENKATHRLKIELEEAPLFELFDNSREFNNWRDKVIQKSEFERLKTARTTLQNRIKKKPRKKSLAKRYETKLKETDRKIANFRQMFKEETGPSLNFLTRNHVAPLISLLSQKPDLSGFTLAMGDDCHLCESDAKTLDGVSKHFGRILGQFDRFGSRNPERIDPERLKVLSSKIRSIAFHDNADQAMGTIDQMLQIENAEIRIELIKALGRLDSGAACRLLACYAKYDVESEVRIAATDALRTFPQKMSRAELLEGFSYPWPDAAKHAAEAIVRLNDTGSIPKLIELLDAPDPRTPKRQENGIFAHREMVAINHLRNCLLCHQDSHELEDRGRGVVPTWNKPLPPEYYANSNPDFARVRADVTYLRQDFSLIRKVKKHGRWPTNQRFDYVARTKELSHSEAERITQELKRRPNQYRASINMALRQLTQKSPRGDSSDDWIKAIRQSGT